MAQDTASGGLSQLEQHYQTFIVRPNLIILVVLMLMKIADRAGFCPDCRCRPQLCSDTYPVLGHRDVGR
jgi:hypothetical protein